MTGKDRTHLRFRQSAALAIFLVSLTAFLLLNGTLAAEAQPTLPPEDSAGLLVPDTLRVTFVLAFDNQPNTDGIVNLTLKFTDTVNSILSATVGRANVTAVILADLDQAGDTHILVAENGVLTAVSGLPNSSGIIDPTLTEYDTTDGVTLGGFLLWANQQYPATKSILSYVGHGAPFGPDSEPAIADIVAGASAASRLPTAVPMPLSVDANPDFTDSHVPGATTSRLLTPYDLALALKIATNNGANKINVLDLVHCFAASIEELTEIAPFADTTAAAPNYAFFDPAMSGAMLADQAADLTMTSVEMANSIVGEYASALPANRHPHVLIAVDNSLVPAIKLHWDAVAQGVMTAFQTNPTTTSNALTQAYQASAGTTTYDSTFCGSGSDYALGAPDALLDLGLFALHLGARLPAVFGDAQATNTAVSSAITTRFTQNGLPWWTPTPSYWNFNAAYGMSIFTPFQPMILQGTQYHAWQSLWYTHTTVVETGVQIGGHLVDVLNPHPYAFILPVGGGATWADVLDTYWRVNQIHPRQDIATALCLPEIREIEEPDLKITMSDSADPIQATLDLAYTLQVVNKATLTADNVVVTTTLPSGVTFTSANLAGCTHQAGIVRCSLGTLSGHQTVTITVNTTIDVATVGPITAVATVRTSSAETRLYDNDSSEQTTVLTAWTLGLASSATQNQIGEGGVVTLTATIENTGRATTTNTRLFTTLPPYVSLAGPVIIEPAGAGTPGTLPTLVHLSDLAPGAQVVVKIPLLMEDGPLSRSIRVRLTSSEVSQPVDSTQIVQVANLAPVAMDDAYTMFNDGSLTTVPVTMTGVLANDADPGMHDTLSAVLHTAPASGALVFNRDGSFAYSPKAGFIGIDSFQYAVQDGDGAQSIATVTIEVLQPIYLPISLNGRR